MLTSPVYAQTTAETISPGTINLDIQSDFTDYDQNLGIARASGDVVVVY